MTIDHLRGVYGDRDIPGIEKMRQVTVTMALANPQMFSDNGVAKPRGYGKGGVGDLKALAAQMVDRMGKVARGQKKKHLNTTLKRMLRTMTRTQLEERKSPNIMAYQSCKHS